MLSRELITVNVLIRLVHDLSVNDFIIVILLKASLLLTNNTQVS